MSDDIFDHVISAKIADLTPDDRNANRGTERGDIMLTQSLQKLGAGRSVLLDRNGRLIAGNKTAAKFGEMGLDDVIIVQTNGRQLVAVQRTDLDIDSPEGREMALADNRTGEVNLSWDTDVLAEIGQEVDLGAWFMPEEMAAWDVEGIPGDVDPRELWEGMPEFQQENQDCYMSIKVNIETPDDLYKLAELLGQKITENTKWINYPYRPPEDLTQYTC